MHSAPKDLERLSEDESGRASALGRILRPGTVIKGKWRLDKLLGVGGMAVVYAATHRNGKRVAIKMLHQELSRNIDVMTRFLREGYLANAVCHEGVVSILDDDVTEDGTIFLVMELFDGETVERRWERKERRLPVTETLSIASELLDVLAAAHAKGVVHRDIKPENIFLTRAGEVKVLDFGIARLRQISGNGMSTTQSGHTMGTPAFMSPEQARGRWDEVDGRSDLWAVGATMFSLLSGRFVHKAGTPNELLLAAMTRFAPKVSSVVPGLAPDVAAVIDRALSFSTQDRWPDARAMQTAVKEAYAVVRGARSGSLAPPRISTTEADETVVTSPLNLDSLLSASRGGKSGAVSRVSRASGAGRTSRPQDGAAGAGTSEAVDAFDEGVANAPSAAPALRAPPIRRSPIYVGLAAGAVGIALTLAALVHRPGPVAAREHDPAASPPSLAAAALVESRPFPVVDLTHDAGIAVGAGTAPSPPATGVPVSITEGAPPPSTHRLASATSSAGSPVSTASAPPSAPGAATSAPPEAKTTAIVTSSPIAEPSAAPARLIPDEPAHAAETPRAAGAPEAAVEPVPGSEGLLDRRH